MDLPLPEKQGNSLILTVLDIDIYGNITLNITQDEFNNFVKNRFCLFAGTAQISTCYNAYDQAGEGQPFLLASSSGYMEVALKNGNAAEQLGMKSSDQVVLTR